MQSGTHSTSTFDASANSHFCEDVDMALNYEGVQATVCIRLIFWHSTLEVSGWNAHGLVKLGTECLHIHALVRTLAMNLSISHAHYAGYVN
jgi:hypothetical protein